MVLLSVNCYLWASFSWHSFDADPVPDPTFHVDAYPDPQVFHIIFVIEKAPVFCSAYYIFDNFYSLKETSKSNSWILSA
jgi:hypothetical protein